MDKRKQYKPTIKANQEEYLVLELKRIKENLNRETSFIRYPKRKDHKPFVFNDLNPYSDTRDIENLINAPESPQTVGYYNRFTATGIVEPWVAHRMEHTVPPEFSRSLIHSVSARGLVAKSESKERPPKNQITGSTLAPKFPKILIKKPKGMNGPFYYNDVEVIRKEFKRNLNNRNRFEEDRNRTINDYYRMNLDQTAEDDKMTRAYHAYLDGTPGSKKALEELLKQQQQQEQQHADNTNKAPENNESNDQNEITA